MAESIEELLTVKDVARLARVDVWTIYRWCRAGVGPRALRVGLARRFRKSDVEAWIQDYVKTRRRGP